MLTKPLLSPRQCPTGRQQGVVLIVALIILVALTLASISLVRSVDTANIIAGNLAFQQSATHSADAGFEEAVKFLQDSTAADLTSDDATNGYFATSGPARNPAPGQSWNAFWIASLRGQARTLPTDSAGNTVSYVIDRQCAFALPASAGGKCASSPQAGAAPEGNAQEAGEVQLNAPTSVYYRITVRVAGPRNTVSYVQGVFAL